MAKSYRALANEVKGATEQTSVEGVREPDEWEVEHIPNATLIPAAYSKLRSPRSYGQGRSHR